MEKFEKTVPARGYSEHIANRHTLLYHAISPVM